MSRPTIRLKIDETYIRDAGRHAYRIIFDLDVREQGGTFQAYPFRLDSGADFTTISTTMASSLGLKWDRTKPIYARTASGKSQSPSYLADLWFSFPSMSNLEFQSRCLVSPSPLKRGLFSLNDLVPHFLIRSH